MNDKWLKVNKGKPLEVSKKLFPVMLKILKEMTGYLPQMEPYHTIKTWLKSLQKQQQKQTSTCCFIEAS